MHKLTTLITPCASIYIMCLTVNICLSFKKINRSSCQRQVEKPHCMEIYAVIQQQFFLAQLNAKDLLNHVRSLISYYKAQRKLHLYQVTEQHSTTRYQKLNSGDSWYNGGCCRYLLLFCSIYKTLFNLQNDCSWNVKGSCRKMIICN